VLSGQKVVVKMFKRLPEERINKEIDINRRLLAGLSAWNKPAEFIHLMDCLRDPTSGTHTLIYQFWPGVPLNELISSTQPSQALKTIYTLAQTLQYIHSLGFVHRDMKPANILMTQNGPKLFDFGLAKEID
jgi:serine/threonine protein kinase